MSARVLRSPLIWPVAALLGVVAAVGLWWFQPWKLVTDTVVDEALPVTVTSPTPDGSPVGSTPPASAGQQASDNRILATGNFVSHEHTTAGAAQIVRLADGRHQLVLHDLDTSNGPDLRVWLTDQPVLAGTAGWRVFDDGAWTELARLKGNQGDQVYEIPAAVDLNGVRSVSIWCKRFAVSFGAAELRIT
jgi:hypothetical protein